MRQPAIQKTKFKAIFKSFFGLFVIRIIYNLTERIDLTKHFPRKIVCDTSEEIMKVKIAEPSRTLSCVEISFVADASIVYVSIGRSVVQGATVALEKIAKPF